MAEGQVTSTSAINDITNKTGIDGPLSSPFNHLFTLFLYFNSCNDEDTDRPFPCEGARIETFLDMEPSQFSFFNGLFFFLRSRMKTRCNFFLALVECSLKVVALESVDWFLNSELFWYIFTAVINSSFLDSCVDINFFLYNDSFFNLRNSTHSYIYNSK